MVVWELTGCILKYKIHWSGKQHVVESFQLQHHRQNPLTQQVAAIAFGAIAAG